jgi:hypothetical protein
VREEDYVCWSLGVQGVYAVFLKNIKERELTVCNNVGCILQLCEA